MKKLFIDKSKSAENTGVALVHAQCSMCRENKKNCAKSSFTETVSIPRYKHNFTKWNYDYKNSTKVVDERGNQMYDNRIISHYICVDCIKQLNTLMKGIKSVKTNTYGMEFGITVGR